MLRDMHVPRCLVLRILPAVVGPCSCIWGLWRLCLWGCSQVPPCNSLTFTVACPLCLCCVCVTDRLTDGLQVPAAVSGAQAAACRGHLGCAWHGLPPFAQSSNPAPGPQVPQHTVG